LLLAAAALLFFPAFANAQINCGDTVGPGGNFNLTSDLVCSTDPAFTIVGPVKVDLKGYTVTCDDEDNDGIIIEGDGATLKNGTVTGCNDGVNAEESNDLFIQKITADLNDSEGFNIEGDRNRLLGNTSSSNDGEGFQLEGADYELIGNVAVFNDSEGFDSETSGSSFRTNYSIENADEGFQIEGPDNLFSANVAYGNGDHGFDVEGASGNVLTGNSSTYNDGRGFSIEEGTTLNGSESIGNDGQGILVDGGNNNIHGNRVLDNGDVGIELEGEGNTIHGNRVLGHDPDLTDEDDTCLLNVWSGNTFDTSDPDCIR
jgi:parallel beta-helix repeat protein